MTSTEQSGPARGMMRFRRSNAPALDAEQTRRQGEITQLAFLLLGREKAIEFLNSENTDLGARPLDLAIASAQGRDSVEAALGRAAFSPSSPPA